MAHRPRPRPQYIYQPLDDSQEEIRLLRLCKSCDPQKPAEPLRFQVLRREFRRRFHWGHRYFALSYAWGGAGDSQIRTRKMLLDEKESLVPETSERALRGIMVAMRGGGVGDDAVD